MRTRSAGDRALLVSALDLHLAPNSGFRATFTTGGGASLSGYGKPEFAARFRLPILVNVRGLFSSGYGRGVFGGKGGGDDLGAPCGDV